MIDYSTQYKLRYAKQKYKRVPLDLPLEMYASIKSLCAARGEPINAYIKRLLAEDAARRDTAEIIFEQQT